MKSLKLASYLKLCTSSLKFCDYNLELCLHYRINGKLSWIAQIYPLVLILCCFLKFWPYPASYTNNIVIVAYVFILPEILRWNLEVLQYRICFSNFFTLLRANCQFINIFLLIGAQKLSKANCSTSHCGLHNTVFYYIILLSNAKRLCDNPSFPTCCPGSSISKKPFLQQKLITIPQLPWAQLSPAGADSCGWALWWPQSHRQLKYF